MSELVELCVICMHASMHACMHVHKLTRASFIKAILFRYLHYQCLYNKSNTVISIHEVHNMSATMSRHTNCQLQDELLQLL